MRHHYTISCNLLIINNTALPSNGISDEAIAVQSLTKEGVILNQRNHQLLPNTEEKREGCFD
jgi:hypothetical protein